MSVNLLGPVEQRVVSDLDRAALRHRLVSENIANIDTPGYKPSHLEFERVLGQASQGLELRRTDERHLGAAPVEPEVVVDFASRRPDGNGVDAEREMADLTANGATYSTLAQVLRGRLSFLRNAILEGRNS